MSINLVNFGFLYIWNNENGFLGFPYKINNLKNIIEILFEKLLILLLEILFRLHLFHNLK